MCKWQVRALAFTVVLTRGIMSSMHDLEAAIAAATGKAHQLSPDGQQRPQPDAAPTSNAETPAFSTHSMQQPSGQTNQHLLPYHLHST